MEQYINNYPRQVKKWEICEYRTWDKQKNSNKIVYLNLNVSVIIL